MSIEVMRQALEVLEQINQLSVGENAISLPGEIDAAMDNLRAAIDQTAEPVAWMYDFMSDNRDEVIRDWMTQDYADITRENGFNVRPLYTRPRQEQPLKIDPAGCHIRAGEVSEPISVGKSSLLQEIVQAIRAAILRSKLNNIRTAPKGDQTIGDLAVRVESLELLCEGIEGESYDQTALELCKECGWRAMIPGDGCLVCARQKAKPVAYVDERIHGWPDCFVMEPDPPHTVPLYTAPHQWVELTDDEARALVNRATFGDRTNWQALVYMVDAKLKEKNHAG